MHFNHGVYFGLNGPKYLQTYFQKCDKKYSFYLDALTSSAFLVASFYLIVQSIGFNLDRPLSL